MLQIYSTSGCPLHGNNENHLPTVLSQLSNGQPSLMAIIKSPCRSNNLRGCNTAGPPYGMNLPMQQYFNRMSFTQNGLRNNPMFAYRPFRIPAGWMGMYGRK